MKTKLMVIRNRLQANYSVEVPSALQEMLVYAEDHRFYRHDGYDVIALARATYRTSLGDRQGGSTIAQQLARVITGRYERTLRRKLREIRLAKMITSTFPKEEIPALYLVVAYFGWRMNGLSEAYRRLNYSGNDLSIEQAAGLIARLKYPEPKLAPPSRKYQIENRRAHLLNLYNRYRSTGLLPKDFFSIIK